MFSFFKLDIFFIYISNDILFPSFSLLLWEPQPHPCSHCFYVGVPISNHSHLPVLVFPYTGVPSLHRTKELSSPIDAVDKAILCYICSWSNGSLHVYSLVGGLVPGSSGVSGWLILLFSL